MYLLKRTAFFVLLAAGAAAAHAEITMEPGLWEMTKTITSNTGEAEREMSELLSITKMPPGQERDQLMAQLEEQGIRFAEDGTPRYLQCVTKAMAAQFPLADRNQPGCKSTVKQNTGDTMEVQIECSAGGDAAHIDITFSGPRNYVMTATTTHKVEDTAAERLTVRSSGTWLGADCGKIRPVQ